MDVYEAAIQWKLNNIYTEWTMDCINTLHHRYHIDAPLMKELGAKLLSITHFPLPIYERILKLCQVVDSTPVHPALSINYITFRPNDIAVLPISTEPHRRYWSSNLIRELLDSTGFLEALSLKELNASFQQWTGNAYTTQGAIAILKQSIPGESEAIDDLIITAKEHFKTHGYPTAIEGIDDAPEYSTDWATNPKP